MTDELATGYARAPDAAGAALRAAREAAGLSIDAVAQNLKLAPRQVRALEDGDYAELPGRTFVRGFARNYARLMQLDPDAVVAALPDSTRSPASEGPTPVHAIGELPPSEVRPRRASAWLIPLGLVAVVAAAAYYEYSRQNEPARRPELRGAIPKRPADPIEPPIAGTPLPNPLTRAEGSAPAPASDPSRDAPAPTGVAPETAPVPATLPITTASAPAGAGNPTATEAATLSIAYRAPAWTEVRDANGQRILLVTGAPGSTQTVSGTPPFELTLGNASETSVTWRGAAFDLAPHVRANIARVRLP